MKYVMKLLAVVLIVQFSIIFAAVKLGDFLASKSGRTLVGSIKEYFESELVKGHNSLNLLVIAFIVILCQWLSGYAFYRLRNNKSEKNEIEEINEIINNPDTNKKEKHKLRWHKFLIYFSTRLIIVTYAVYEFTAFYAISLMTFGYILSSGGIESAEISTDLLKVMGWTTLSSVAIVLFLKLFLEKVLIKKLRFMERCNISRTTLAGNFVHDFQMQLCNVLFILILPLTLLGVYGQVVKESEQLLFFSLTSLVIAAYSFMIAKSKLYNLLFELID